MLEHSQDLSRGTRFALLARVSRDASFTMRTAIRRPAFASLVLAALALGIGLTTAIFSVFYGVLLRPLPYNKADRLVLVKERVAQTPVPIDLSPADALEFSTAPGFSQTAIFVPSLRNMQVAGQPERVQVLRASASLLPLLGISPSRGRAFSYNEDIGGLRVAMVTDSFERSRFGRTGALGKSLLLEDVPYEIIGVLPTQLVAPLMDAVRSSQSADVWIPLSLTSAERSPQNPDYSYSLLARLAMVPIERTSPFASATATAIVSACTSKPTKRILVMRPTPFVCGSAPLDSPPTQRNPRYCDSVVGRSIVTNPA